MNIIEDNTTIERLSDSFRRYLLSLSKQRPWNKPVRAKKLFSRP
ncbi:hypothetical protein [Brevibacillus invocatus]|nr:hypothetical protein [Brevibacillus invocatus]